MNKKTIIISLLFTGLLFVQSPVRAQTQDPLPELPGAGLTPNSPFYFLERASEAIGEFLTFDTEAKARLQAERALERIAEVKTMLAEKEVNPRGLNVALEKLQTNIAKAAEIVQKEQQKGQDVSKLAKELDTDFEVRERLLKRTWEEKERQLEHAFKEQKLELKKQLLDAKSAGDAQKVGEVVLALDKLEQEKEAQEFLLEQKEEEFGLALEIEEEKFELAMEEKERELESKEKEAELAFEKKKRELKRQFKEAKQAVELKEEALENQFDVALALGNSQDIENIKAQLLAIGGEESSLDSKFEELDRAFDEVERNFELLPLKEERGLEDFVRQEELALKKAEFEMEQVPREEGGPDPEKLKREGVSVKDNDEEIDNRVVDEIDNMEDNDDNGHDLEPSQEEYEPTYEDQFNKVRYSLDGSKEEISDGIFKRNNCFSIDECERIICGNPNNDCIILHLLRESDRFDELYKDTQYDNEFENHNDDGPDDHRDNESDDHYDSSGLQDENNSYSNDNHDE